MARPKKQTGKKAGVSQSRVTISRTEEDQSFFDKFQNDLQKNQNYLNLVLGALIVIVVGVLLFNYFNKPVSDLGPSESTTQTTDESGDVMKEALPGNYTVKEGDTLFTIAQKYYDDGYKYTEIIKENNLANENVITAGQVLKIPKIEQAVAESTDSTPSASVSPSPGTIAEGSPEASAQPTGTAQSDESSKGASFGTGGAVNQTIWGEKITSETYTVQSGDWLSTIAGRAYGDIFAYQKIAQANNIQNPDLIEPGTVLKIPR